MRRWVDVGVLRGRDKHAIQGRRTIVSSSVVLQSRKTKQPKESVVKTEEAPKSTEREAVVDRSSAIISKDYFEAIKR